MPDRPSDPQLKSLEIDILPTQRQQLADTKSCRRVQENQSSFSHGKMRKKQLQLCKFKNIRYALSLRAL